MKKIVIIGAGGNSKVIIDIIKARIQMGEEIQIAGILDDDSEKNHLKSYPVLGGLEKIHELKGDPEIRFVNGIGNNEVRKKTVRLYPDVPYYTAIHPSAIIGSDVIIGSGSVIMPGVVINADTCIGEHVLINTGSIIEHDNKIDDFVHVASGAATAGNVQIGEGSMLGTGAKVIQSLEIGKNVMIGAGAVVISDIPDGCTAVGVPAKVRG